MPDAVPQLLTAARREWSLVPRWTDVPLRPAGEVGVAASILRADAATGRAGQAGGVPVQHISAVDGSHSPVGGRLAAWAAGVAAVGLVAGVADEVGQGVLRGSWIWLSHSLWVWLLFAYGTGLVVREPRRAAWMGVVVEAALLVGFYIAVGVDPHRSATVSSMVPWFVGAVVGGLLFGAAGAWVFAPARWFRMGGAAVMPGAALAEAAWRWVHYPWQGASGPIMSVAAVVLAAGLGWRAMRGRGDVVPYLGALVAASGLGYAGLVVINALT